MQGQFCPSSRSGTAAWNNYTQVLHNHDEYFVLTKSSSDDPGNLGLTTVMSSFHAPHIDFKLLDAYPEKDGANSSGSTKMSLL
ncbi:hypothetical protein O6P43_009831 [Quillaja saponaria]|uniref:Uncharacterized protein n=1 Tax=Quillaja saponaria TaxID=32244 RepID=A0AAD7PZ84_QUISA|nr:hypothetical protein O6P43_009831 [Quillaja saponaria]